MFSTVSVGKNVVFSSHHIFCRKGSSNFLWLTHTQVYMFLITQCIPFTTENPTVRSVTCTYILLCNSHLGLDISKANCVSD